MTRKEYMKYVEGIYRASRGLIQLTPEDKLDFKPKDGLMTIAQVLKHLSACLGESLTMAIDQSWPKMPEGEMLPTADKLPKSESAAEALKEIDRDWELLKKQSERIDDREFNEKSFQVPWMPFPMTYEEFMMQALEHMSNHRMQLFIWLKLAGLDLHTGHLYGMP